jgi:uncharacterized protein (TIGR02680 family)
VTDNLTVLERPQRWTPTRAGLIGLWRYAEETFTFHHGRLLLRGPNGSGKSMALELLLPFLLDGETSPVRLTSAAKSRGRLYDRMMAGGNDPTRTGFAWAEFRRGDDVFTVGARLRASQATNKVDAVFFTTTLQVGTELQLLDESRTPLPKQALADAIGDTGRVHASAEEHRAAVREALFPGFNADRYASVINALLALRKEKLSQNLDPEKLSDVLSDALPPLDDQDVAVLAEGFERLDRRRAELAALERDLEEVKGLARRQRDYARAVVVGAARGVRAAESRRDTVTRAEREAREALAAADARSIFVTEERAGLEQRYDALGVQIDALKDSDAYRAGAGLADLRRLADQSREAAGRAERIATERADEHAGAIDENEAARAERESAEANRERAESDLRTACEPVGALDVVGDAVRGEHDDGERLVRAWSRAQRTRIEEVRRRLDEHDDAVRRRGFLDEQVAADERVVDDRSQAHDASDTELSTVSTAYADAVVQWAHSCDQVGPVLQSALPAPPDDPVVVGAVVADVAAAAREQLALAGQVVASAREVAEQERAGHVAERARWEDGELVDPDAPLWRSSREGLAGAPLWQLVDVVPGTPDDVVDNVEAALTAAGLVDAWIRPDGGVDVAGERADLFLGSRPAGSRTLADLLAPAWDGVVGADVVAGVLESISLADRVADTTAEVVIGCDASYRLGSATGRGPQRPAMFLGAIARERHRLARLAEIDVAIAAVDRRLADLDRQSADLGRKRTAVDAEIGSTPSGEPVEAARRALAAAAARLGEATTRLETTREERRIAEDAVRTALRELTAVAAQHGLPAERAALIELEAGLNRLDEAVGVWARRAHEQQAAARHEQRTADRVEVTTRAAARARADHVVAEREATDVADRLATLEESVGSSYADVVREVTAREQKRAADRNSWRALDAEKTALDQQVGQLSSRVDAAAADRADADAERDRTQKRLAAALADLGADAAVDVPTSLDTATATLAAARTIVAAHEQLDVDDRTVNGLSERVGERLHQAQTMLGARVDLDRELSDDGWWALRTTSAGVRRRIADLLASLTTTLQAGRDELASAEEELFERTLAGGVRRALADRIRQANALTDDINDQLKQIRTAAGGVEVRLKWEVDSEQPLAVRSARQLLLRDPADLSDAERQSLQDFVRARIDQARAELEADAPWEARLRETLDYRSWHRFSLQVAHRDWDGFQVATPRKLARLSTGERSIVLHLPMIASVAAHYSGDAAFSSCPRLILLDELFAGVDVANRSQLFGTFSTWDLDAVFTSDSEWCSYATLDGIAIHHLHPPVSDDEPVTSTRFTWDGRVKVMDPAA